jgi:GNAT superfamily N-acetyltransferase
MIMSIGLEMRRATSFERDALRALQAASLRGLATAYYDEDVIETFIARIGTMDDTMLDDGTYYAATCDGVLVGCGGWSARTPGYAAHLAAGGSRAAEPGATVRSIYVHPEWARRGVARRVMAVIEADIAAAGYAKASLTATLGGIPLYRRLGYRLGLPVVLALGEGRTFVGIGMAKPVGRSAVPLQSVA